MKNKDYSFVSAVLYVYNAEDIITDFLRMVVRVLKNNFDQGEIICVNDHSNDESVSKIQEVCVDDGEITVSILNMSKYHGVETAMSAGVDLAIGDFVFEFDKLTQDFAEDDIMKVYNKALEGFDIVSAIPDRQQRVSSSFFYYIFNKFSGDQYHFKSESFRLISRRAVNRVYSMNLSVPYRKIQYLSCGLRTDYIAYKAINVNDRIKPDWKEKRYRQGLAVDVLILFTDIGYRFSFWMTMVMIGVTMLMAIYAVAVYLMSKPVEGWTTTVLFMSFAFFGLFGILTIIIKYLQILVDLIFRKKKYSFESIEKITK